MQTARLLLLTLLAVILGGVPALAQSGLPSEMPHEALSEGDGINSAACYSATAAPVVAIPNAPTPQSARIEGGRLQGARIIDKKFIAVMGALAGAESLRLTAHKLVLDHEFAAGAPWITSVPPNQDLVAKYAGFYAAELLVAYELKKPHSWLPGDKVIRKLWWAYPAATAPIHIMNGVRSIRTQPPSCPADECDSQ